MVKRFWPWWAEDWVDAVVYWFAMAFLGAVGLGALLLLVYVAFLPT